MEYYIRETLITDFQDVKTLKNKRKCFSFFFELRLFSPQCLFIVYFFYLLHVRINTSPLFIKTTTRPTALIHITKYSEALASRLLKGHMTQLSLRTILPPAHTKNLHRQQPTTWLDS
ncbi:Schizosaccharomyces pombe specific protein, expressed during meiotic cell cycle [Schizosaccharomyces pombe]|uniref:Uncharacterized protein C29E6.07 n=1 Tax=Schizosaccharomyces pombe (strain 972 / ATCC 24843) TaxID=284812 RepID=YAF7_SCHPO|nr:uncharacterized protein SPAC29E6.07 [Schizosaccharomyces pombe]Q09861.1 RecName: Full=Uncharacterized protein C29E6.07 [Schizosaccharomyces pombe 972h-]CAA91429.1 very hypothetical protein [Schizosaccharomyces pombe]CAB66470.1 sequence orphan [Schizosaccharomyces pombe]|eukprot:NP_594565.1 uncharacterized protein SPAC29E6.07 [Schizosaccharomyces pombe]